MTLTAGPNLTIYTKEKNSIQKLFLRQFIRTLTKQPRRCFVTETFCYRRRFVCMETFCLYGDVLFVWRRFVCMETFCLYGDVLSMRRFVCAPLR
jgi:hypothetical protein